MSEDVHVCPHCGGERWRAVVGFPKHEVSSFGRVRWAGSLRMVKARPNRGGHLRVRLRRSDGVKAQPFVHRLVLASFVGPCPVGMECAHWDGDKTNNCLENLRWATQKENFADAVRHGVVGPLNRGDHHANAKLTEANVRAIVAELLNGGRPKDIAERFGVHNSQISRIRSGDHWSHVTRPLLEGRAS